MLKAVAKHLEAGILKRGVASLLVAALFIAVPGPQFYQAWGQVTRGGVVAPRSGGQGLELGGALNPGGFELAPGLSGPSGALDLSLDLDLGGLDLQAAPALGAAPAAVQAMGSAPAAPLQFQRELATPDKVPDRALSTPSFRPRASRKQRGASPRSGAVSSDEIEAVQEHLAPSKADLDTPEAGRGWSARAFGALTGLWGYKPRAEIKGASALTANRVGEESPEQPAEDAADLRPEALPAPAFRTEAVAPPAPEAAPVPASLPREPLLTRVKRTLLVSLIPAGAALPALVGSLGGISAQGVGGLGAGAWGWVATAGYWAGNLVAAVFPFAQIYETLKTGETKNLPVSGLLVGFGASLLLAMNAVAHGAALWGVQNLVSGLGLLAIPLLKWALSSAPMRARLQKLGAVRGTLLLGGVIAALSYLLYFAAAGWVPLWIPQLDVLVGQLTGGLLQSATLAAQALAVAGFTYLFLPFMAQIQRRRSAAGISSGFVGMFFASSVGMLAWALHGAFAAGLGSPAGIEFLLYAGINLLYGVVSLRALRMIRQFRKNPAPPAEEREKSPTLDRHVHENILGFRKVVGVRHSDEVLPKLGASANAAAVQKRIRRQFAVSQEALEKFAGAHGLSLTDRDAWLAVYDRMQDENYKRFQTLDAQKYKYDDAGKKNLGRLGLMAALGAMFYGLGAVPLAWVVLISGLGWFVLANLGNIKSAFLAVPKSLVGLTVRFPYHLFDMFFFGYYRKSIAFRFLHADEDFLSIQANEREPAGAVSVGERYLELAVAKQSRAQRNPVGALSARLAGSPILRVVRQFVWYPLALPTLQFLTRRVSLAVMSLAAMGVLGGLAPLLPLSFNLLSIPILGPALAGLGAGVPQLLAMIPGIGQPLAEVAAVFFDKLLGDLILGPVLSTAILAFLLTWPRTAWQMASQANHERIRAGNGPSPKILLLPAAMARALFSFSGFWKPYFKTLLGLMVVGAEIEGIMKYTDKVDAAVDPVFEKITGHRPGIFHAIGASVERPEGASPIPFGGAITWGNTLLYKAQVLLGVNIADTVMFATNQIVKKYQPIEDPDGGFDLIPERPADIPRLEDTPGEQGNAATLVGRSSHRIDQVSSHELNEEYQQILERLKERVEDSGDLEQEIALAREKLRDIRAALNQAEADLQHLRDHPVDRSELEAKLEELRRAREEMYALSKLAEDHDIAQFNDPQARAALERQAAYLDQLIASYEGVLQAPQNLPTTLDAAQTAAATQAALQERLREGFVPEAGREIRDARPLSEADRQVVREIEALLGEIDAARHGSETALTERERHARVLVAYTQARNAALRDRRGGEDMLEFRENLAKLSMATDLRLSLKEIESAESAINGMLELVDQRIEAARQHEAEQNDLQEQNRRNRENAVNEYTAEIEKDIADDTESRDDLVSVKFRTGLAVQHIPAFPPAVEAVLAQIDARDKAGSVDALTEYQRRLDLIPQIAEWNQNGRPPGNEGGVGGISVKETQDRLTEVNDLLGEIDDGLGRLDTVPVEFAGVLIIEVGSPKVSVVNPSQGQVLQIVNDRIAHWQAERADYQSELDDINRMLDPNNTARRTDDFGDSIPESLPRWKAEMLDVAATNRAAAQALISEIDALAAQITAVTGGSLPTLAGKSVDELKDILQTYLDEVAKLHAPDTDAGFQATMRRIELSQKFAQMADHVVEWARGEKIAEAIDEAVTGVLPKAQVALGDAVAGVDGLLADLQQDLQYAQSTSHSNAENQALIERKRALLTQTLRPMLMRQQAFLQGDLLPFAEDQVANASGEDSLKTLYEKKKDLYERVREGLTETFPWAIVSSGAEEGNLGQAETEIGAYKQELVDGLKTIAEGREEVDNRRNPNYMGTEQRFGETMPVSLPRMIDQYQGEMTQRAAQFNAFAGEINTILAEIDRVTANKYNMVQRFTLPTDIDAADPNAGQRLEDLNDSNIIQNLADQLEAIGDVVKESDTELDVFSGDGTVPSGEQEPITLGADQQAALLALDAAKRLAPSTLSAGNDSLAWAMARFIFSDGVVDTAKEALEPGGKLDKAEEFLDLAEGEVNNALADVEFDYAYVRQVAGGGPPPETYQQVVARKTALFQRLDNMAQAGVDFFELKLGWDREGYETLNDINRYYDALDDIYDGGNTVGGSEVEALNEIKDALNDVLKDLQEKKRDVNKWLGQLDPAEESALERMRISINEIQEKTRTLLMANFKYHEQKEQFDEADRRLNASLRDLDEKQGRLSTLLQSLEEPHRLPAELVGRLDQVMARRGAWLLQGDERMGEAIVIEKKHYMSFIEDLFSQVDPNNSSRSMLALKNDILNNPGALAALVPNSRMIEVGDDANGFYLVYNSFFRTPGGLKTGSNVTLGNVFRAMDSNVSFTGYRFISPPNEVNAPYGDQGVSMTIESIEGKNWVNYLDITFHKFSQDIPVDTGVRGQADEGRMMIFDDFALLLQDGKLYFGAAGFADFALKDTAETPYYYGGNVKMSYQFTQIAKLNVEETQMFVRDPRSYLQRINLDFTGFNPDLNQEFVISADADDRHYQRHRAGVELDLNQIDAVREAQKGTFAEGPLTVEFYVQRTEGNVELSQDSGGVSIVKGFTIRSKDSFIGSDISITNRFSAEAGTEANIYREQISIGLPEYGVMLNASGKLIGGAESYYVELAKQMGPTSSASISYGSKYVGMPPHLAIQFNTNFTLGDLWNSVKDKGAAELQGGETLSDFNDRTSEFFKAASPNDAAVAELERVFANDVMGRVLKQDVGRLTRELQDLQKAGAIMDNMHQRATLGFVTAAAGDSTSERAVGGGWQVGTETRFEMTKTQRELVENRIHHIYRESLQLQMRLVEATREWQETVLDLAQAQWRVRIAEYMAQNAADPSLRGEALAEKTAAEGAYRQALLRYNSMTGRDMRAVPEFANMNPADLQALMQRLRADLSKPARLTHLLSMLDPENLAVPMVEQGSARYDEATGTVVFEGGSRFNIADWIPWVEQVTLFVGVSYADLLENQAFGVGAEIKLPIYDPGADNEERALVLENQALAAEMRGVYTTYATRARVEREEAGYWDRQRANLAEGQPGAARDLSRTMSAYRNDLAGAAQLRDAFEDWRWYTNELLNAQGREALQSAWAGMDGRMGSSAVPARQFTRTAPMGDLDDVLTIARAEDPTLVSLERRSQAAREMMRSADHRFSNVMLNVRVGPQLTTSGVSLIPTFAATGFAVQPIFSFELTPEELRQLEVEEHEQKSVLYSQLRAKVESDLVIQTYQAYTTYRLSLEAIDVIGRRLEERRAAGADAREIDELEFGLEAARHRVLQAQGVLNTLHGRPAGAPVDMTMSTDEALAQLETYFKANDPVGNREAILRSRTNIARAVEMKVTKNLTSETRVAEPISMVLHSFVRLIESFAAGPSGPQDVVSRARLQRLEAERAQLGFQDGLPVMRREAWARWYAAERAGERARGEQGTSGELARLEARIEGYRAAALLAATGETPAPYQATGRMPASWNDLRRDVVSVYREQAFNIDPEAGARELVPTGERLAPEGPKATGNYRYYEALRDFARDPIGTKHFESWVTYRLDTIGTPSEVLAAVARYQEEQADRYARIEVNRSQVEAEMLLSRFESNVQALRWIDAEIAAGRGASLASIRVDLDRLVREDGRTLVVKLGLPTDTHLNDLQALVPRGEHGIRSPLEAAEDHLRDVEALGLAALRYTIFEDAVLPGGRLEPGDPEVAEFLRGRALGFMFGDETERVMNDQPGAPTMRLEKTVDVVLNGAVAARATLVQQGQAWRLSAGEADRLNQELAGRVADAELRRALVTYLGPEIERAARRDNGSLINVEGLGEPLNPGFEDELMAQLRANVIAERMSYKGFSPTITFGMFRGKEIGGLFLTAPDPEQIERALSDILSTQLKADLEKQGRLRGLTLRLHSLMVGVEDEAKLVEVQRARLVEAERSYRAAMALVGAGRGSSAEMVEAQATLHRAWQDFHGTVGSLRVRFIELVTELRALGVPARSAEYGAATRSSEELLGFIGAERLDALGDLRRYLSRRLLDPAFESAFYERLRVLGDAYPEDRVARLREAVDLFRAMERSAEAVRMQSTDPRERMDLLIRADVEGRRQDVEAALSNVLAAVGSLDPATNPSWTSMRDFVLGDLRSQHIRSVADLDREREISRELRDAFWHSYTAPPAVEGAFRELTQLQRKAEDARYALYVDYLTGTENAERMILRDRLLDDYLKAKEAYTSAVVAVFQQDAVKNDPIAARGLDALFGLHVSAADQKGGILYGRGIHAVEALIEINEIRLNGLRYENASREEIARVGTVLSSLQQLRERWLANPREMRPLYAATRIGEDGRRTWDVESWLTPEDVVLLENAKRVVVTADGHRVLMPEGWDGSQPADLQAAMRAGGRELISGIDQTQDEIDRSLADLDYHRYRLELANVLKEKDFAVVREDGAYRYTMTWENFDQLHAQGRMFYFAAEPHPTRGTHAQIHPMEARWMRPDKYVAYVYMGDQALSRDAYPTLESLRGGADLDNDFMRVVVGEKGVERLRVELREREVEAQRTGWLHLKLNTYGFAVDPNGILKGVYLTEDEFKEAREEQADPPKPEDVQAGRANAVAAPDWVFYRGDDLELGLNAAGAVVEVVLPGGRGTQRVAIPLAAPHDSDRAVASRVQGDLLAVTTDENGRILRSWTDERALKRDAAAFRLETVEGGAPVEVIDGAQINPVYRLKQYTHEGRPVMLSNNYLQQLYEEADSEIGSIRRRPFMPWNWHHILLETPRGLLDTPRELITGFDPKQDGYLGRNYMLKTFGGTTERHGFPMGILYFIDRNTLGLLPDPVGRFYDPSQFPDQVNVDAPVPGLQIWELDPQTREHDIHVGRRGAERVRRYAAEDLENSRAVVRGHFEGSVLKSMVESRRGLEGAYPDSRIEVRAGVEVVNQALAEIGRIADERGRAMIDVTPRHLEVDRVQAEFMVRPGSYQYAYWRWAMNGYSEWLDNERSDASRRGNEIVGGLPGQRRALNDAVAARDAARQRYRELSEETERLRWETAEKEADRARKIEILERAIARLNELWDWWYKRLQDLLGRDPGPNPWEPNPDEDLPARESVWTWLVRLLGIGFIAYGAYAGTQSVLRRRRKGAPGPSWIPGREAARKLWNKLPERVRRPFERRRGPEVPESLENRTVAGPMNLPAGFDPKRRVNVHDVDAADGDVEKLAAALGVPADALRAARKGAETKGAETKGAEGGERLDLDQRQVDNGEAKKD